MKSITRQLAAVGAVLALGATPAVAGATPSSKSAATAKTPLTAQIVKQTALIKLSYTLNQGVDGGLGRNAVSSSYAANLVRRVPADSAQRTAKLEWVLGADLQRRADNTVAYGQHELVYHHSATGKRLVAEGLGDWRLANYFFANAASRLGIAHPKYMAEPYQPHKGEPVKSSTPLIAKAPRPTLAGMAAAAGPVLELSVPDHVLGTFVELNQDAAAYYAAAVGAMHVDHAQQSAQRQWVAGVNTLGRGDAQLTKAVEGVRVVPPRASTKRAIASALATFRRANSQIGKADALLGVHRSGSTVQLPAHLVYQY